MCPVEDDLFTLCRVARGLSLVGLPGFREERERELRMMKMNEGLI